jgi:hypothetical protein
VATDFLVDTGSSIPPAGAVGVVAIGGVTVGAVTVAIGYCQLLLRGVVARTY